VTIAVANTANTNDVTYWRTRTNEMAAAFSNKTVTVDSNTATGNASVNGTFQAVNIFANVVSGGVIGAASNVNFTSNAVFSAKVNLGGIANVLISGANATHRVIVANSAAGGILATKITLSGDVSDANVTAPANNDVLLYSNSESAFKNTPIATAVGLVSVNAAFLEGHNTSYFANATHVHAFSSLTGIPNTMAGYGITEAFFGNSTVNAIMNSTVVVVQNSTSAVTHGSDTLSLGNSTVNAIVNSTTVVVQNSTSAVTHGLATLFVGNSTVNAIVNSTAIRVSNSTSNTFLTIPTAAQRGAGTYYLNANGSWGLLDKNESIMVAVYDETSTITTGTAKITFRMPYAFTLTAVRASLTNASSSGTPTIDINENGASILSTKITIDANELTSTTAATAPVLSDTSLADDASMTIDVDVAGTGAKGLKVYLIGHQ
jgi:hypothetical protein